MPFERTITITVLPRVEAYQMEYRFTDAYWNVNRLEMEVGETYDAIYVLVLDKELRDEVVVGGITFRLEEMLYRARAGVQRIRVSRAEDVARHIAENLIGVGVSGKTDAISFTSEFDWWSGNRIATRFHITGASPGTARLSAYVIVDRFLLNYRRVE